MQNTIQMCNNFMQFVHTGIRMALKTPIFSQYIQTRKNCSYHLFMHMPGLPISTNIALHLFSHLDDPVHHILTSPKQFCLLNSRVLQQLPPRLLYFPSDFTGVHLKTMHIFWYHYSIHMEELRKSQNTAKIASLQPQNQNWYLKKIEC